MFQTSIVIVVVACSALHAFWTLMPRRLRQLLARKLLRLPLPGVISTFLQEATVAHSACHGCEHAAKARSGSATPTSTAKTHTVVFHRKRGH